MFRLADRLHKSVLEIMCLPRSELVGWQAYFEILQSERKS